jgi:hypothetical protein
MLMPFMGRSNRFSWISWSVQYWTMPVENVSVGIGWQEGIMLLMSIIGHGLAGNSVPTDGGI